MCARVSVCARACESACARVRGRTQADRQTRRTDRDLISSALTDLRPSVPKLAAYGISTSIRLHRPCSAAWKTRRRTRDCRARPLRERARVSLARTGAPAHALLICGGRCAGPACGVTWIEPLSWLTESLMFFGSCLPNCICRPKGRAPSRAPAEAARTAPVSERGVRPKTRVPPPRRPRRPHITEPPAQRAAC